MGKFLFYFKWCIAEITCVSLIIACSTFYSHVVFADQTIYGPKFEIGIGATGLQTHSRSEWISKHYTSGVMTLSYRIVNGISIQGGKNFGYGKKQSLKWINYGDHAQVNLENGTYTEDLWFGARYEIPMSKLNRDYSGIHTIYCAGGVIRGEYGIRGKNYRYYQTENGWDLSEVFETRTSESSLKTADLTGYYITLAARWRVDTAYTEEEDSWLGSYGLDIGVRYARYPGCNTKYDNIIKAKSNFNYYQIFIIAFLKLRFLY